MTIDGQTPFAPEQERQWALIPGASARGASRSEDALAQMSFYQRFCNDVLLPVSDLVLGQDVHTRLQEIRKFQWASRDEIDAYRSRRLQQLVTYTAARVPRYRRYFAAHGLQPEQIVSPSQLPLLPILDKQTIRERFADLLVDNYRGVTTEMKSSGSTGVQTTVLLDKACNRDVFATQLLFWSWGGFAMGQPHLQTGMSLNRGPLKRAKDLLFRCTYTSAFDLTDETLAGIAGQIERKQIRALFGYASSLYVLARYYERHGLKQPMESIFTWGDSLFPHYREAVEQVFTARVNDCYGLGEGLQCAAQCEQHGVLHEAMHGVIMEIVDRDGQPCRPGELGRVLVTRLEPGPMPLLRYDTGDVASFIEEPCPCGRQLRGVSRIQGRSTDIVTTPAGDRLIVHFFTQIFEMEPTIAQFQVRQEVADRIRLLIVCGRGFEPSVLARVEAQIRGECRFPLAIDVEFVDDIPLEKSNKRRFVISAVPF